MITMFAVLAIIGIFLYINHNPPLKKDFKSFLKDKKVKPKCDGGYPITADLLRQYFLSDYPEHREILTDENFVGLSMNFLVSANIVKDETHFYVNPDSPILQKGEPTTEYPPLPEGWENIQ